MRKRAFFASGIVVIVAAAVAITLVATDSGSSSANKAQQVLSQALAAAQLAGSLHFVDRTVTSGQEEVIQGAISAPAAAESITGDVVPLQVELVDGVVYVDAGASILSGTLGLSSAAAAADAGKWISVQPSDQPFDTLTQDLVLSATLDEFTPTSHLELGKVQRVDGHRVLPVTGTPAASVADGASANAALFVETAAPHLPIAGSLIEATKSARLQEEAVFTNWGATIVLQPPSSTVAYSSIAN